MKEKSQYISAIKDGSSLIQFTNEDILFKINHRHEYNVRCINKIKEIIDKYPDWRFGQILYNMGLWQDLFYEESIDTFNRIEKFS